MCVKVEAKSTSHLCSTHVTGHGNSILHQSEPKHLRILHSFSCGIDLQSVSDILLVDIQYQSEPNHLRILHSFSRGIDS